MVKWLIGLVVVLALAWGGWWVVGARAVERGAVQLIDGARNAGWDITYDDLSVVGFPSRFDTTLTDPAITPPSGEVRFTAPFLQAFALSYRLNHLIFVAPNDMAFAIPGEVVDVTNADLRGSVVVSASTQPVLDRTAVTAETLRLTIADLWLEIEAGQFASRQAGGDTVHEVALSLADISFAPGLRAAFDPAGRLPDTIDALEVQATVTLTEPIGPNRAPRAEIIALRQGQITWGQTRADLTGDLTIGENGRANGALTLGLTNWQPFIDHALAQGLLTPTQALLISGGISGLLDDQGVAQLPVTVRDGLVSVLGLPVALLPLL